MENKILSLSNEDFINIIKQSINIKEVLFRLNYTTVGNSWGYSLIKKRMSELGLTGFDFKGKDGLKKLVTKQSVSNEEYFQKNSIYSRHQIRCRIIRDNLLPYKCSICNISNWNSKSLSLELDHINGINNDHRLENLRFLCPNCHSQTSTYGSRNSNRLVNKILDLTDDEKDIIELEYKDVLNIKITANNLNIPINTVRKVVYDRKLSPSQFNAIGIIVESLNEDEYYRFPSKIDAANFIISKNLLKTKSHKVAKVTLNRHLKDNRSIEWLGYKWTVIDYKNDDLMVT